MKILSLIILSPLSFGCADASGHEGMHPYHHLTGKPGTESDVTRTIDIQVDDAMRFTPSDISVQRGETVKFIVKNNGKLRHEMVLGSAADLKAHAKHMLKFPRMKHTEPNQLSVEPGKRKELIWSFLRDGVLDFACLEPGHLEAGMAGRIRIR